MAAEVVITSEGLQQRSVVARLRTTSSLLRLWIVRDLRARYRFSSLRASWSVIQPVVLLATYGWVFTAVLDVGEEQVPYLSFAWAGLVVYSYAAQCLGAGVGSLLDAGFVVSKVYFPREVVPLAVVGVATVDLAITGTILLVLSWVQIGPPTIHVLGALLALVMMVVLMAATTTIVAALAVSLRDVRHVMPLVVRVLFIITPVMYSIELIEVHGSWLGTLNPLTVAMEAVRDGALRHRWPAFAPLLGYLSASIALCYVAIRFVWRAERSMTDRL